EKLQAEITMFEEEKKMGYANTIEGMAHKRGKAEALIQVLERRLNSKLPDELTARIKSAKDLADIERWMDLAVEAASLEDFRRQASL
ncbi:MAG TPA: hypothetical protein VGY58_09265, partial [Gemmataceae bacterium]|nr:hypothetical protein [Gemmataceae bacterium]